MSSSNQTEHSAHSQLNSLHKAQQQPSTTQLQQHPHSNNYNPDQSIPSTSTASSQNQKWQKIISQQAAEQQSTPFLLKPQSFTSSNQAQQFVRQKAMMEQAASKGRQLLTQKSYQQASKQLSKTLMAFEFIAKNYAQTIPKQLLKEMMIQTVLPAYNNLALCYLKLKNFQLVVSFTNQVLGQDDGNVKARYRRATAFKELKNTEQAIKDFEIVKRLDPEMKGDCEERIRECRLLEVEIRKKRKLAAQKFISGYEREEGKASNNNKWENTTIQTSNQAKQQQDEKPKRFNLIEWIKQKCQNCTKVFSRFRPNNPSSQGKKDQ